MKTSRVKAASLMNIVQGGAVLIGKYFCLYSKMNKYK